MTTVDENQNRPTPRRRFLSRLLGGGAAFTLLGTPATLLAADGMGADHGAQGDDWMNDLKGKHRTVFDAAAHINGKPLVQAKNYLDAWRDAFKVEERDLNLVIGIHGDGIPLVLTDALWSKYKIGEQYTVTDGSTKSPGVRNVFTMPHAASAGLVTAEQTVESLQKRGVRLLICMNTIAGATKKLTAAGLGTSDEIHAAIMGGLLPGVMTVPSMVVTLTQLQEHGVRYTKIV
jgi:intracellular sulfur oxidation DsrE/DsrF family protein